MLSKDEILSLLAGLSTDLGHRFKVRKIGLFGFYAREEQRPDSDIDLLVDFVEDADLFDLVGLKYFFKRPAAPPGRHRTRTYPP